MVYVLLAALIGMIILFRKEKNAIHMYFAKRLYDIINDVGMYAVMDTVKWNITKEKHSEIDKMDEDELHEYVEKSLDKVRGKIQTLEDKVDSQEKPSVQ